MLLPVISSISTCSTPPVVHPHTQKKQKKKKKQFRWNRFTFTSGVRCNGPVGRWRRRCCHERFSADSGFCVLLLVAALCTFGLFPICQIKKRRYWPKHLPISNIETQLGTMSVGDWGVHKGTFLAVPVFVVYLKDEDYNSLFMCGCAPNRRSGKMQIRQNGAVKFQYPAVEAEYYEARPYVDHANENRVEVPMEKTYGTNRIIVRDWTCDLEMSEANALGWWNNHMHPDKKDSAVHFRKALIKEQLQELELGFLYGPDDVERLFASGSGGANAEAAAVAGGALAPSPVAVRTPNGKKRVKVDPIVTGPVAHKLKMIPAGHKNKVIDVGGVLQFATITGKSKYHSWRCSQPGCKKLVRTYCMCEATVAEGYKTMLCHDHYALHAASTATVLD